MYSKKSLYNYVNVYVCIDVNIYVNIYIIYFIYIRGYACRRIMKLYNAVVSNAV